MRPLRLLVTQDLANEIGVRYELVVVHASHHGTIRADRSASGDRVSDHTIAALPAMWGRQAAWRWRGCYVAAGFRASKSVRDIVERKTPSRSICSCMSLSRSR